MVSYTTRGKAKVKLDRKPYGLKRIFVNRRGQQTEDTVWYHSEQSRDYAFRITEGVIGLYRIANVGTLTEIERVEQ